VLNSSNSVQSNKSSFDLPDDVFQPGETRPVRPKKKVVKKTEGSSQKRSIDALDVSCLETIDQRWMTRAQLVLNAFQPLVVSGMG
jgi:hypothetical protein